MVSERNLYGKAATEEASVRLSSVGWSKALNIRTESSDIGHFYACHNCNGFIADGMVVKNNRQSIYNLMLVKKASF